MLRRSSLDSHNSGPSVPQILVNDENFDLASPAAPINASQVRFSGVDKHEPFPTMQTPRLHSMKVPTITLSVGNSRDNSDIDLEAQSPGRDSVMLRSRPRRSYTSYGPDFEPDTHDVSDVGDGLPLLARSPPMARRHSTSSSSISTPAILDASPQRRTLGIQRDPALQVTSRKLQAPLTKWGRALSASSEPKIEHTPRPPLEEEQLASDATQEVAWHLSALAAERLEGAAGRLNPFFEWRSGKG